MSFGEVFSPSVVASAVHAASQSTQTILSVATVVMLAVDPEFEDLIQRGVKENVNVKKSFVSIK